MKNIDIALESVRRASGKLEEILKKEIIIQSQKNKDIKLEADKLAEEIIINTTSEFSSYKILSEENPEKVNYLIEGDFLWIVDPLDGSLNYSRGVPFYCISMSLWKNGVPVLGVVRDLVAKKNYYGELGSGAFCDGIKIFPSKIALKNQAIMSTGFPVYSDFSSENLIQFINTIQEYKKIRLLGSAAMSITLVAKGSIEAYAENNIAIWDVAGALAILKAAGGDFSITPGRGVNLVNVFASNGILR